MTMNVRHFRMNAESASMQASLPTKGEQLPGEAPSPITEEVPWSPLMNPLPSISIVPAATVLWGVMTSGRLPLSVALNVDLGSEGRVASRRPKTPPWEHPSRKTGSPERAAATAARHARQE
jgi:hypothetical protein